MKRVYAIYDSNYVSGKCLSMLVLVENDNINKMEYIVESLQRDYYDLMVNEREGTCLKDYIYNGLENMGFEFMPLLGEHDLAW